MMDKPNIFSVLFHKHSPMVAADEQFDKAKNEVMEAEGRIRNVLLDLLEENDRLRDEKHREH